MKLKDGFLFGCGALLAVFCILFLAGNTFAAGGSSTGVNLSEYSGAICVTGTGYVYAEPDIAKITIGVITEAGTSTQAMDDNANRMDEVVKAIKRLGIADKDIQTSRVSVEPQYASEYPVSYSSYYPYTSRQNITGYKATNTVCVTLRDLSKVGPAIDAANDAGSNTIQGVTFLLSEERQSAAYTEALEKAVADGSGKAKTMATAAGVENYKLKTLSESGGYYPIYSDNYYAGAEMAKATGASTPISAGQAKVQATVSMNYVFMPR
ncbi:SIMPL domain-containing protein [Methanocella sp. MCL-LM]|uniref:SIMPL domain-containing protein n=1 Tax=Methanocella sp. MCL-LM TaxID=3412035 RepID=UPI003C74D850